MTAKELQEQLAKCHPDAVVCLSIDDFEYVEFESLYNDTDKDGMIGNVLLRLKRPNGLEWALLEGWKEE